jgi:hypothetical protein
MSTEYIRQVAVGKDGSVFLNSKSDNDDQPYQLWKCDSLTEIYKNEGQRGLDREIVRILCEYAAIKGSHPSVERYRPCLLARGHFSAGHTETLNAEYAKLTPEDLATQWLPQERQTDAMREYHQFSDKERDKYYTALAGCAAPLPLSREKSDRDHSAR